MDIYIARQPIFTKHMKIYGYEFLYRSNEFPKTDRSRQGELLKKYKNKI